ncbi:LptA/OstA family protein [Terrihabitans sp. B22-R8]|uniref:LptA/OstA family protein n=1 Tax=Terrihabitans sp. B22-R8 TaxID=3425128 RepID=UPI00403C77FF
MNARLLFAALLCLAGSPALAQQAVTSAFSGFSGSSGEPVQIEADRLDVREKDQAAIFSGNVFVKQGASSLRTRQLTILYDNQNGGAPAAPVAASPGANVSPMGRNIRRLEAKGSVEVMSGDQKAVGDQGEFDMPSNKAILRGNVVVTQGTNVLKGERLFVDLTTQQSRLEAANTGRVQGVFTPGQGRPGP